MDAFKSPSPVPDNNPILEIRSYLVANQQVIRAIDTDLKENSIETRMALQKISAIEGTMLVIINRIDRLEEDYKEDKRQSYSSKSIAWGALLAAILAVITPYVIRPGVNSGGLGQGK